MSQFVWNSPRAAWAAALALTLLASNSLGAAATKSASLVPSKQPQPSRVKVVLEVDGHLLTRPIKPATEPQQLQLKAKGQFLYEERIAPKTAGEAIRYYLQAAAEIAVDGHPSEASVREQRKFIAVNASDPDAVFRSLQGALTREELELIELPGGSHVIDQLLPGRDIKVGETWSHDDALMAQLLNLGAVTVNEVTSQLVAIDHDKQVARLKLTGRVLGYAAGVTTEITVEGKYNFDLVKHRVTWLAMGIQEQRDIGATKPGLKVHARLRMLVEEKSPQNLSVDAIKAVFVGAPEPTGLLEYSPSHGRFTLMHDRRWHVISERPDLIVMRMVEDGQVIAQCNLRSLPPRASGQIASLSHFQEEIRTALGSSAQQIVDSNESEMPNGQRQLRVAVVGEVATAPVQWIYYQLTDSSRQLLTCAFTMAGKEVERFGAEDALFVGHLIMNPAPSDDQEDSKQVADRRTEDSAQ